MFSSSLLLIVNLHQSKQVNTCLCGWHLYFGHCGSGCFLCVYGKGHSGKSIIILYNFFFFCFHPFSNLSLSFCSVSHLPLCAFQTVPAPGKVCFSAAYSLLAPRNLMAARCIPCGGQEGGPGTETRARCSHLQLSNFHCQRVQRLSGN